MKLTLPIDRTPSVADIRRLSRQINRNRILSTESRSGLRREVTSTGTKLMQRRRPTASVSASSSGVWAATISGGNVVVGAGSIFFKFNYYAASAETVAVNGGSSSAPDYVLAKFVLSTLQLSILANTVSTVPASTSNELYFVLHEVYRNGALAVLKRQRMNSDIITLGTLT